MNWRTLMIVGILPGGMIGPATASEITVISFGRADQAALTKAYYRPFHDATGIEVKSFSYDGQTTELEQMAKTGKTIWDVIQVESRTLELGCRDGLFEKLDFGKIGSASDFIPGAVSDCGVGIFAWSVALAYDADKVKGAPKSWADFWDLKKYPGKRGLRRSAKYTLEIALLADSVAPADVYKILATKQGVDRAFSKLDQIKRDIVWWQAAAEPALFLNDGIFVMTSAYTLWIDRDQQQKRHLKIAWDGSLYDVDSWAIPKNTPKVSEAYQFIAFASKPENQKALSEQLAYGPTNKNVLPLLDKELASTLPSTEVNFKGALKVNTAFWIRHGEALEKRFDGWAPPICVQQTDEDEPDADYKGRTECQDIRGNLRTLHDKLHTKQGTPPAH
ncbi:MAG TPA: ABC transporter substrate-binding protein [Casimicrobiaceae bacterium]|jgi:putative spermidine/putrescine transport system substrate-binding protein|nr:ABC transporter substrate-binding protein [Casimicrobiaceae bacterium]